MHNFSVMAQVLLNGESRFLSPCDFKELGVAKQSRSTTSARSALRQPWSIIARTNIFEGRNKPQCCPTETVSSYSSRGSPLFRLHGVRHSNSRRCRCSLPHLGRGIADG